jgi:hypothetical protein
MEPVTIKTPADVLSFVRHTLGFWPQESLVCITLDANRIGATLRVDLPRRGSEVTYARTVADYLAHDTSAASVLFPVYTSEPQKPGQPKPHAATIAALTGALAERGMSIRDGLLVGDKTVSQYDGDPLDGPTLPLAATQSSQINAEFVYRGSTIAPSNRITLPASAKETKAADAVDDRMKSIYNMNTNDALNQARALWDGMLDATAYPSDDQISLIANFQSPGIRDQLMADIHGIDEPWTASSSPRHKAGPNGPESNGPSSCCSTRTRTAAPNTRRPSSPPSPSSTGGKAEEAKPTSSFNSHSKPTRPTAWPG